MLENRHHNIILDFNGNRGGDERWKVYPLSPESQSMLNYQRIRSYVNSCNGLLFFFDDNDGEACICNPATNQSRVIPFPSIVDFPPPGSDSFSGCSGLGFDSRSNDYKFLIFVDHFSADSLSSYVFLYSLKTDSWRSLTGFPRPVAFTEPCVYADGSIYWLKLAFTPYFSIDSFDFADEAFSSFDTSFQTDFYQVGLVAGSRLGLVAYKINSPYCFEIWVKTTTAGNSWNFDKLWDFSLPQILDLPHRYPTHDLFILGFSGDILYLVAANGEVFAYDCTANRLEKLQIRLRKYRDPVFISYAETTVSPSR